MKADDKPIERIRREFKGGSLDGKTRNIPLGTVAVKLKEEVWRLNMGTLKFELETK